MVISAHLAKTGHPDSTFKSMLLRQYELGHISYEHLLEYLQAERALVQQEQQHRPLLLPTRTAAN
ncbi:hypothetical protein GO988_15980 [Hymenobacter sp. HMF4947]|uniref:Uncharacterized protein n=1 Tax=Hymenobacter ginkgonis TaxID=2682976 RepID=A0A7K1TI43_9BACT|nr:hypothetical protein [Hymenobacter ginkgonis]MVN77831.1 hypothetical protein [Hymenobacter ginkgonis]